MASTEYERKRLENIKRNNEMMAALKIRSKADTLSAIIKLQRAKTYPVKKPKTETPVVVTRRSLRKRGMPPDSKGLADGFRYNFDKTPKFSSPLKPTSAHVLGPISMTDAFSEYEMEPNKVLIGKILNIARENEVSAYVQDEFDEKGKSGSCNGEVLECPVKVEKVKEELKEKFDRKPELISSGLVKGMVRNEFMDGTIKIEKSELWLESLDLKPENVAQLLPGRIMVVKFFPCSQIRMIAAGNDSGDIAFWNVDSEDESDDGIYLYHPHTGSISGILIQRHSMSKIFTSCHDGFLRLMDAEKEMFDLVHHCDDTIFSLSQQHNNLTSLYFGEGRGGLNIWDIRTGKSCDNWILHKDRINTIDFNSQNPNLMATSSSDGTAQIWDIRGVSKHKTKSLKTVTHDRALHTAYFSPSGSSLATTSLDKKVGILSGVNYEDISMIYRYNQTGRFSYYGATWGWDDSYIFMGSLRRRGVDVICAAQRRIITTLQSLNMSAIPCRFHSHPYDVGTLAAATKGGHVYIWTPR